MVDGESGSLKLPTVFHHQNRVCIECFLLYVVNIRWPSGLFSCRPHSLELTPEFHPGPDHRFGLFQTAA